MNEYLKTVCDSLDALAAHVLASWADDRTLREVFGWHHAALTRHDISDMSKALAEKIRAVSPETVDAGLLVRLKDIPRRLTLLHSETVPYMFNGNGHQALPAYTETIEWMEKILQPLLGWQSLSDNKSLPGPLAKRLRSIQVELDDLVINKGQLQDQIKLIQDATETAESLPADLQSLKEAHEIIVNLTKDATEIYGKIDQKYKDSVGLVGFIDDKKVEADKLVLQCDEAYRVTTTVGLAAAFDQRAIRLGRSMWVWVFGLFVSLIVGAYMGSHRIELLTAVIGGEIVNWGVVWMQVILSVFSVGAPIWFAWLATKQIGQRFRLAEDYGFKASVAKAYEGYRREAARIDEAFEARLFASVLTRLDEAPLRLVEGVTHGSPWHELITSDAFQKAIGIVPELKDKFIDVAKAGLSKIGTANPKKSDTEE